MMACPKCAHQHLVQSGKVRGAQRWLFRGCGYQFTRPTPRGRPVWQKSLAVFLYCHGMSMHALGKMFDVHASSVLKWIRRYAAEHYAKPAPSGNAITMELDEIVAVPPKKRRKLWIWKALDRDTGQLLDWECGRRDAATLKKLVDRLAQWDVTFYCTDHWKSYAAVIPAAKLVMSKAHTEGIERKHSRQRHWFGCFKRKSIIVSKATEMVDLTIALFARFRVNGDVAEIFTLDMIT